MRVLVCVLVASAAWADVPPSDSSGCRDKTEGASCARDDGTPGSCGKATCSKNDYSNGVPPKSVTYDCLKCGSVVAAAPAPAPAPTPTPEKKPSCAAVPGELPIAVFAFAFFRRRVV